MTGRVAQTEAERVLRAVEKLASPILQVTRPLSPGRSSAPSMALTLRAALPCEPAVLPVCLARAERGDGNRGNSEIETAREQAIVDRFGLGFIGADVGAVAAGHVGQWQVDGASETVAALAGGDAAATVFAAI